MTEGARARRRMIVAVMAMAFWLAGSLMAAEKGPAPEPEVKPPTQGALKAELPDGKKVECPLKHTSVHAEVAGFLGEVWVRQHFQNPFKDKIEAVYVFPLPEDSAVDEMIMIVGDRDIYGEIHERARARYMYEQARSEGRRAALLEQERANIFTQSVANIQPGEEIIISLHYVQPLKYDAGTYRYHFPMVVGPRFIPGGATGKKGTGWAPDTDAVPDASRITPPVLKPGFRTGHDISLEVKVNAGVPISDVKSKSHQVVLTRKGPSEVAVALKPGDTIPNKDFMLSYKVSGDRPRSALLAHRSQAGGYFMLMLQPSTDNVTKQYEAKELFFVLDCSGSMSGYPIQKSKQAMVHCIRGIGPADTFQIIRFSSNASQFSPKPLESTFENKRKALEYVDGLSGSGGTQMIEGIKAALDYERDPERQRYVFFMTDGFIGNENQILAAIKEKLGDARIFSFGIGSSANRQIIEGMAKTGKGVSHFVRQDEDPAAVITEMYARLSRPYLTDVKLEVDGVKVSELYPKPLPDLLQAQPMLIFGTYDGSGPATATLTGKLNGKPYEEKVKVEFPAWEPENQCLVSTWARQKIQQLTFDQLGKRADLSKQITELALEFHLMSKYTSFVAVDDQMTEGMGSTLPRMVTVPVPMPEGVSFAGVFGSPQWYRGAAVGGEGEGKEKVGLFFYYGGEFSAARAMGIQPAPGRPAASAPFAKRREAGKLVALSLGALVEVDEELRAPVSLGDKLAAKDMDKLAKADEKLYRSFVNGYHYGDAKACNEALAKLLTSKENGALTAALALTQQMCARGFDLTDANEKALAEMLKPVDPKKRSAALQIKLLMTEKPAADLVDAASKDGDARTRMLAAWRLVQNPKLEAPDALARLLGDADPGVLALAVKAAGQVRKDAAHTMLLGSILIKRNAEKFAPAMLEAAIGLAAIAKDNAEARTDARAILFNGLARWADQEHKLAPAVMVACMKGIGSDKDRDHLALYRKLMDKKFAVPVRTLAAERTLGYGPQEIYAAYKQILDDPELSTQPELMTIAVKAVRNATMIFSSLKPYQDQAEAALKLLASGKYDAARYGLVRVGLVEIALMHPMGEYVEKVTPLMRTDTDWRVRRAILAALARRQGDAFRKAADLAIEDPHHVIRTIGLTGLVALKAPEKKRTEYLNKITRSPKASTCEAILRAEGVSPDLALRSADEIREAL